MSEWLGLAGRTIVVCGAKNRRSVATHVGLALREVGARVLWVVRSEERRGELARRLAPDPILVCDVEDQAEVDALGRALAAEHPAIDGLVHSVAFANYEGGVRPFEATPKADFLRAIDVSCYSLLNLANALSERFTDGASVVTISISHTDMAAENYGFMAPAKAALDSSVAFLAKSFGARGVRFNAVRAGLLKTSSSAGIPGYVESYLFAEECTLRKRAVETREVADAALYLLSPRSSGVDASAIVVDAGMRVNYFDREVVERATRVPEPGGGAR